MSDHHPFDDQPPDDDPFLETEMASLAALLGDEAVWSEPAPDLEDTIVAAIRREAGTDQRGPAPEHRLGAGPIREESPAPEAEIVPLDRHRGRRWVGPVLGAAAALLAVVGFSLGARLLESDSAPDELVALVGTDLAPDATAVAEVATTPLGTRIMLDVSDLPPAPDGQYYEAWLRQSPEIGVSAGTFHLRGGDGAIELWAGVAIDDYPLVTVTLQEEGAGAASSGQVVLKGSIED